MPEKYQFDPNEGRITVDEEGNVVPDNPEPTPHTWRSDQIDEGHQEVAGPDRVSEVSSEPATTPDHTPNSYWPSAEDKEAAARAKTQRDEMIRRRPPEPWQKTTDSDEDDEGSHN